MGRITINGTQAGFSCKKEVSLALWDVKTNRAKGKSEEARTLNQELDNIKAQITRHYQYCLLYTSDAADDLLCVDLGARRILKKKKTKKH